VIEEIEKISESSIHGLVKQSVYNFKYKNKKLFLYTTSEQIDHNPQVGQTIVWLGECSLLINFKNNEINYFFFFF
jgi:hypothetical protein